MKNSHFALKFWSAVDSKTDTITHKVMTFIIDDGDKKYFYGDFIAPAINLGLASKMYITVLENLFTKEYKESIRDGESIYKPLAASGQFPPMVTDMIEVGEESGQLAEVLGKVADFAEMELEEAVRNLLSAFEPLIILFMAVGVGILIIAMFLPLFKMSDMVG